MIDETFQTELQDFVQDHPHGWSHDDWLRFLYQLSEAGVDTVDEDAIGLALERERLKQTLARLNLKGLGPRRIETVVDHFKTLWNLQDASWETVGEIRTIPRAMAQEIVDRVRSL